MDELLKYAVYWNSHKKTYSIKSLKENKVVNYSNDMIMKNVKFVVNQKGRTRVLRENRKNVHAYIMGEIVCYNTNHRVFGGEKVFYNPYKHIGFTLENGNTIMSAEYVYLNVRDKKPIIRVEK